MSKIYRCEEFIAKHPDHKDSERKEALENIIRYNKDLEKYYYRFNHEECTEQKSK